MGLSAALAAREQIQRSEAFWRDTHLWGVLLMVLTVLVPLGIYLFACHPAWSMLYRLDPGDISFWHGLWILPGAPAAGALGYLAGALLRRRVQTAAAAAACGLGAVGLVIALVLFGDRLARLTDGVDWQDAPSVLSGDLAAVFAFALPMVLGAWSFLIVLYEVEGRKLHRAASAQPAARRPSTHA